MKIKTENIFTKSNRYSIITICILLLIFIIILRLIFLQILYGDFYLMQSERNMIRIKRIPPLRGTILDANKNILATNKPAFSLYLNRKDLKENKITIEEMIDTLSYLIELDKDKARATIDKYKKFSDAQPIKILSNLKWEQLVKIESSSAFLPGIYVDFDPIRYYLNGDINAHILGYVSEVDKKELERFDELAPGDFSGKTGIEGFYNKLLIGKSGKKRVVVDALGNELKVTSTVNPENGKTLILSIDNELQKFAYNLLDNKSGSIIAIDVNTGMIKCFVSAPSFDPNIFSKGITSQEWNMLNSDKLKPLSNKGISGLYPPGSTFKVITATAGLSLKIISPSDLLYCSGTYTLGNAKYRCWKKEGHGAIGMIRAIKESCDVYFYDLGSRVGITGIYETGSEFGLGFKTGIDLVGEKEGLLPSKAWKQKHLKTKWYAGETPPIAIGQGYTTVTPLQMLMVYSAIANGGILYEPRLVSTILDNQGNIIENIEPKILRKLKFSDEVLKIIQTGLDKVVNEQGGTAYSSRIKDFKYSGKTGTAQVRKLGEHREKNINKIEYEERDHAWFVAYAPSENPQLAVVVLVEHAGHGGSASAPLAKEIIKKYFNIQE